MKKSAYRYSIFFFSPGRQSKLVVKESEIPYNSKLNSTLSSGHGLIDFFSIITYTSVNTLESGVSVHLWVHKQTIEAVLPGKPAQELDPFSEFTEAVAF